MPAVKSLLQLAVHPLASVIVTVYVPVVLTAIHCVDCPVLHKYADIPAVAHHCVEPVQIDASPVIRHEGAPDTPTIAEQVVVQLCPSVTVTVYVPGAKLLIEISVPPLLHRYEYGKVPPVALTVTDPFCNPHVVEFAIALHVKTGGLTN